MDSSGRWIGTGCGCCGLSRRRFLTGCAACAAGLAGAAPSIAKAADQGSSEKARVRLVFSHTPSTGPIWPNIGFDFEPRKKEVAEKLQKLCPNVEFLPVTAMNVAEAKKLLEEDKQRNVDGYVVCLQSCWAGVPAAIMASGKPVILADELYQGSGEWLIQNAAARRQKLKAAGISSSRIEDLADAARCFEILKKPDGTVDASRNRIIYCHCVGPTKVFGPQGASNPFHIRSHSEDRKGAAIRALLPLGYLVSTLEFHPVRREVILHQGRSVENVDEDRACRTKLAAEVKGDIEKLMNEWEQWGWHRVTVYGDVKEPVQELAKALGLKWLEEA